MNAHWLFYAPIAVVALACAGMNLHAWRKRILRRRAAVSRIGSDIEKHIAVGSLSGVAPSDIAAHVLLVLEAGGEVTISGTGCDSLRMVLVTSAAVAFAQAAHAAHEHEHEHGGGS